MNFRGLARALPPVSCSLVDHTLRNVELVTSGQARGTQRHADPKTPVGPALTRATLHSRRPPGKTRDHGLRDSPPHVAGSWPSLATSPRGTVAPPAPTVCNGARGCSAVLSGPVEGGVVDLSVTCVHCTDPKPDIRRLLGLKGDLALFVSEAVLCSGLSCPTSVFPESISSYSATKLQRLQKHVFQPNVAAQWVTLKK